MAYLFGSLHDYQTISPIMGNANASTYLPRCGVREDRLITIDHDNDHITSFAESHREKSILPFLFLRGLEVPSSPSTPEASPLSSFYVNTGLTVMCDGILRHQRQRSFEIIWDLEGRHVRFDPGRFKRRRGLCLAAATWVSFDSNS